MTRSNKNSVTVSTTAGLFLLAFGVASAQDNNSQAAAKPVTSIDQDISMLRKDLRSQRKQIIAANMSLTSEEAEKFWPV